MNIPHGSQPYAALTYAALRPAGRTAQVVVAPPAADQTKAETTPSTSRGIKSPSWDAPLYSAARNHPRTDVAESRPSELSQDAVSELPQRRAALQTFREMARIEQWMDQDVGFQIVDVFA